MKIVSSREVYSSPIFQVTEDQAVDPDGFEIRRGIVRHRGSAVMMAVDERNRILLVRQYRLPAQAYLWELPAGRLDEGENTLQAARRELREETGYRARRWKKLISFYPSPGFLTEKMTVYLATELSAGTAQ
ncbi:MAG: NUDIX hydrolase, partial [bacterium]|nr:NUDIX hydrolase [bacterium]